MQWVHYYATLLFFILYLLQVNASDYYNLTLTHDGPVMLGGTITFRADLYQEDGERPSALFKYTWRDNALIPHEYESPKTYNTTTYYSINYPRETTAVGVYEMEVVVSKKIFMFPVWEPITSVRTKFVITSFVNGNITLSQGNDTLESSFVSSVNETNMTVAIRKGDYDYLADKATALTTYWFIDCKYFGETSDLSFQYNFTNPNVSHTIDALLVASYDPPTTVPPPTTTTLPPSTTSAPSNTTTSNTTSSNATETTTVSPMTTTVPTTTLVPTTTNLDNNTSSTVAANISLPFICSNSSIIPMDPNKSYGHFSRKIDVRAPISNITVEGTNWIKPWEMLSLNVSCKGSGPFNKCLHFHRGMYNVTGNETCDNGDHIHSCNFSIIHYFLEPSVYTILVILNNDVSTQIYPLTINIYKVTKKPQLSVIVVPVSCTLAAVILIVFGVAYYIQSRARFTVEVADFDFGQNNPDMEYKTFSERLRDSFNNAINPGNKRISVRQPYYGSMNH